MPGLTCPQKELKANLAGYQSGFPVIRELVQSTTGNRLYNEDAPA